MITPCRKVVDKDGVAGQVEVGVGKLKLRRLHLDQQPNRCLIPGRSI